MLKAIPYQSCTCVRSRLAHRSCCISMSKRPRPLLNRLLLTGSVTCTSMCSFVLAYIANRNSNSIWCHNVPYTSSYSARAREEACYAYTMFQLLIACTCIIGSLFIIAGFIIPFKRHEVAKVP